MNTLVEEIANLVLKGWRPYRGEVQPSVYEGLNCTYGLLTKRETRTRPYWFSRGDIFCCIGCPRKCCLSRPGGFRPALPIHYDYDPEQPFTLPPQELVRRRHTLRVPEAAYCLNISEELVYKKIAMGELVALKGNPKRVRASDVEMLMNDFDE